MQPTDGGVVLAVSDIRPCSVLHEVKKTVGGGIFLLPSYLLAVYSPLRQRPRERRKMEGRMEESMEAQLASSSAPKIQERPQLPPPPWSSPYTVVEHRVGTQQLEA